MKDDISKQEHEAGKLVREILDDYQFRNPKVLEAVRGERDWVIITYKGREYKLNIYEVGGPNFESD